MASEGRPLSSSTRHRDFHPSQSPNRRRRSQHLQYPPRMIAADVLNDGHTHTFIDSEHGENGRHYLIDGTSDQKDGNNIAISSTSRAAGQNVAPFLAKHIPELYNPVGGRSSPTMATTDRETKFCYRHRPDLKCRRQANEPSMDLLQKDLSELSKSDQQGIAHVWSLFSAAPAKQRDLMLKGILAQCCFPQLSMIAGSIRELIKIDFLFALPTELAFKILCYLDTTSLCNAAQVSRHWRGLADDDVIWHRMCEQHIDRKCTKCGWGLPMLDRKRLRMEKRSMQLRAKARGLNEWSPAISPIPMSPPGSRESSVDQAESGLKRPVDASLPAAELPAKRRCRGDDERPGTPGSSAEQRLSRRPWKDVYKARFKVGTNWKHGRCTTRIFKGHQNGVLCLQFDDHFLATGSYDATIKIWDIKTGECLRTLTGHTSGIRCLQFDPDAATLMSGSLDTTVKIWNWKTGELKRTLPQHTEGVISLSFAGQTLVSGSIDKTVRVWEFKTGESFVLQGHTDWVNQVRYDPASRTVLSASDDSTVRLWDLDTRTCIRIFEGHVGQVQQVLTMPPEFEIDEHDLRSQDGHDQDTDTEREDDRRPSSPRHDPQNQTHHTSHMSNGVEPLDAAQLCGSQPPITPLFPGSEGYDPSRPSPPRYMLTGGLDCTIRSWDVATGRCLWTGFGHLEGIWALAADSLRVVTGAQDRMVKVWEPTTGKWERNFLGHNGPVTCLGLSDSKLVTGSEDCEIRVMEFGELGVEGVSSPVG